MYLKLRFTLLCAALACYLALAPARAQAVEGEFTPIVGGKDLSGWVVEGRKDYQVGQKTTPIWTLQDGEIRCAGKGYGFLRYDEKLCDHIVRLEYNMNPGCNSGIGIRGVKFTGQSKTRPSFAGFELQILDDAGSKCTNHSSMSLYRYIAAKENAVKPAGQWNQIEIEIRGPRTKVTLNGKLMHDVDQSSNKAIRSKPLCGYFSLQNHGHPIRFRNIELLRIEPQEEKP
jgi:hypothetical protein